jgi:hypothetical protein
MCLADPAAMSVSIHMFVHNPRVTRVRHISPWRLRVLCWHGKRYLAIDAFQYQWINNNIRAFLWAIKNKCYSLASQMDCMAVRQVHMLSHIYMKDPTGVAMGEIDSMVNGKPLYWEDVPISNTGSPDAHEGLICDIPCIRAGACDSQAVSSLMI